jgi:hypothetical protein
VNDSAVLADVRRGRTDRFFDLFANRGAPASAADLQEAFTWCAYFGDVSALRFGLEHGLALQALGDDLGLHAAAFHGHWPLCEFLLERGAPVNRTLAATGETPLHAATSHLDRARYDRVVRVLLAHGADPNLATQPGIETGDFMRDARTRGETPLHRAAAFAGEETIDLLLAAGATIDARDAHGDTPLSWASWARRPVGILRKLLFGDQTISPSYRSLAEHLLGEPGPLTESGGKQARIR